METITRMIWCELCYWQNADDVARWVYEGRGAAVQGVLRVPAECRSCEVKLPTSARVVAVTIRHGGPWYEPWEKEVFETTEKPTEGSGE